MIWGIVGYRHFYDATRFDRELQSILKQQNGNMPSRIVSGGASGADTLAREWASAHKIPITEHKPKAFTSFELLARNSLIANDCDLLIAFVSKNSRGTFDTIAKTKRLNKLVIQISID